MPRAAHSQPISGIVAESVLDTALCADGFVSPKGRFRGERPRIVTVCERPRSTMFRVLSVLRQQWCYHVLEVTQEAHPCPRPRSLPADARPRTSIPRTRRAV